MSYYGIDPLSLSWNISEPWTGLSGHHRIFLRVNNPDNHVEIGVDGEDFLDLYMKCPDQEAPIRISKGILVREGLSACAVLQITCTVCKKEITGRLETPAMQLAVSAETLRVQQEILKTLQVIHNQKK